MPNNIFIKRFLHDEEKITIEINNIKDNDEIIIENQNEFIKYILSSIKCLLKTIDNQKYTIEKFLEFISNFFDKVNNIIEKQSEIFQKHFLDGLKKN